MRTRPEQLVPQPSLKILYSVTPSELQVVEPLLENLWEFGPNSIDPVTSSVLRDWISNGELAVALSINGDAAVNNIDELFEIALKNGMPCKLLVAIGTSRMANIRDASRMIRVLVEANSPLFLYSPSDEIDMSFISQGLYLVRSGLFESNLPLLGTHMVPRINIHHDILTYATTSFIRKEFRGTGLLEKLTLGKAGSFIPSYSQALRKGNKLFWLFTTNDREEGLKMAISYMKLVGVMVQKLSQTINWGIVNAVRVIHWRMYDSNMKLYIRAYLLCLDPHVEYLRLAKL